MRTALRSTMRLGMRGMLGMMGLLGLMGFTGCSLTGAASPQSPAYYVIQDLRPAQATPPRPAGIVLMLGGSSAAALHDSDRMVFTRDGQAFGYYQFAHWSERPGKRLAALAEQRLAASGRFGAVVQSIAGVRGDWLMQLRLDELTHDDRAAPGAVSLRVSAELIDWRNRTLLGRQTFEQRVDVPSRDARGAAQAASEASTRMLDAIDTWVGGMVSTASGSRTGAGPVPLSR